MRDCIAVKSLRGRRLTVEGVAKCPETSYGRFLGDDLEGFDKGENGGKGSWILGKTKTSRWKMDLDWGNVGVPCSC